MSCKRSFIKITKGHGVKYKITPRVQQSHIALLASSFFTSAPNRVTDLVVVDTRATEVDLDWGDVQTDLDSYTVYVQEVATGDIVQSITGIILSEVTVMGLIGQTEYEFLVRAVLDNIESGDSNRVVTTTEKLCNISIIEVITDKFDGEVTISAETEKPPLEYRIEQEGAVVVDWQSSEVIALDPGTYTAIVRDDIACTDSKQFTLDPKPAEERAVEFTGTQKIDTGIPTDFNGIPEFTVLTLINPHFNRGFKGIAGRRGTGDTRGYTGVNNGLIVGYGDFTGDSLKSFVDDTVLIGRTIDRNNLKLKMYYVEQENIFTVTTDSITKENFLIGDAGAANTGFSGIIQSVWVLDRQITIAEFLSFREDLSLMGGDNNLIHHWELNDISGGQTNDKVTGQTATITGDLKLTDSIIQPNPTPLKMFTEKPFGGPPTGWKSIWEVSEWAVENKLSPFGNQCLFNSGDNRDRIAYTLNELNNESDVEVLALAMPASGTDPTLLRLYGRVSGADGSEKGYRVELDAGDNFNIKKYDASSTTTVLQSSVFDYKKNHWYWIRFRLNGENLKGKIWDISEQEPSSWNVETTDAEFSQGGFGVGHFDLAGAENRYRIFTYALNGATADISNNEINSVYRDFQFDNQLGSLEDSRWANMEGNTYWNITSTTTLSDGTGPSDAFEGDRYVFCEVSNQAIGEESSMQLNLYKPSTGSISFAWHRFGANQGTTYLEVYDGNEWVELWKSVGDQGDQWFTEDIVFNQSISKLRFRNVRGNDFDGDVALDSIVVQTQYELIKQGFEQTFGLWKQPSESNGSWEGSTSGTPSADTGASAPYRGQRFLFVECSDNGGSFTAGDTDIIEYGLTGLHDGDISFAWHQWGANQGTLYLEGYDGSNWIELWQSAGDKGNQWNESPIINFTNMMALRFRNVAAGDFTGDVCVDNINVKERAVV